MSKAKKEAAIQPKKQLRKEVASTLTEVFSDIKEAVGKKKFGKKVKKASKLLIAGAAKNIQEKPAKKATEKKKELKAAKTPKAPKPAKAPKAAKPSKKVVKEGKKKKEGKKVSDVATASAEA